MKVLVAPTPSPILVVVYVMIFTFSCFCMGKWYLIVFFCLFLINLLFWNNFRFTRKLQRWDRKFLYSPHPVSLCWYLILPSRVCQGWETDIIAKETPDLIWISLDFSLLSSLCSRSYAREPCRIELSCLPSPLWSLTVSQSVLVFVTLMIWRNTGKLSCSLRASLGLSDVITRMGLKVFGKNVTDAKYSSHHPIIKACIPSTWRHWWCKPASLG